MKKIFLPVILSALVFTSCFSDDTTEYNPPEFVFPEVYHNHEELEDFLSSAQQQHSDIVSVEEIGVSEEGRSIHAVTISDNPSILEMEPAVRFTGDIHGNEPVSGEILIQMIEYLIANSSSDKIKTLINSRRIVFIPMLNPDGVESGRRYNANRVDLNRNFSVEWKAANTHGDTPFSEKESAAFRDYSLSNVFHLSATYHSGEVVVNMPFDYVSETVDGVVPAEYDLVKELALTYTEEGTFLSNPDVMDRSYVTNGTTNGGDWYIINGSLQDWSYVETGCIDLTIEVADSTPRTAEGIEQVFNYNRDSMLAYIESAGRGVCGKVTDSSGNPVSNVKVSVDGGDLVTRTDKEGYYHKILLPADYTLRFVKDDIEKETEEVTVAEGNAVQMDIIINQ